MKRLFLFAFQLLFCLHLFASHYKAGEITYHVVGYLQYEVTFTAYAEFIGPPSTLADKDSIDIVWGYNTTSKLIRTNGPVGPSGVPQGEIIYSGANTRIKKSEYKGKHTYAGPLSHFVISVEDPFRIDGIKNINRQQSGSVEFFVEDTLWIRDPVTIGHNDSPLLLNAPIDFANINDTFYHNPNAFDPDGDSLCYQVVVPLQGPGSQVPNYQYPEEVNISPDDGFTIDVKTGEIEWATPKEEGIYTVAILITEYRDKIKMGTVLRDMQIIVGPNNNDPPRIAELHDTCVIAGSLLSINVMATDPNSGQNIMLTAAGGPFNTASNSPATFSLSSPSGNPVSGLFEWQTNCTHIRRQFYEVVFKAVDSYVIPLADLETWLINVVAPPPEDLTAEAIGNQVHLSWNSSYACGTIQSFIGYSVWRREGSNPFVPGTCDIGLAGRGYVKVAEKLQTASYIDLHVGRGKQYCYRVLAEFAERTAIGLLYNKVESIPSNEACAMLSRDVPVISNASVVATDHSNGKMFVGWYNPVAGADNLDTTVFLPPYQYKLLRSEGFNGNSLTEIYATPQALTFSALTDTTYTDSSLNTVDEAYSYRVDFYANHNQLVGSSEVGSSIFLKTESRSNEIVLSWQAEVPWTNEQYEVYRLSVSGFDPIATTNDTFYIDKGLINDSLYCYKILGYGRYSDPSLINDILYNYSQEVCGRPMDKTPPCPPVLTVLNGCDQINNSEYCLPDNDVSFEFNRLTWISDFNSECMNDIEHYNIYYSLLTSFDDHMEIGRTNLNTYDANLAGCFAVTTVDSNGNESALSNIICEDYCPCYKLPNVFTPNGDGDNDYYTPFRNPITGKFLFRFVDHVDMKIFNRWGNLVFKTDDPEIWWNGNDFKTNKPLKEGVYYYTCTIYDQSFEGVKKNEEILSGYIHLIRGNGEVLN